MEQDRKEKAPVPAKVGDVAVPEKERVAVKNAAGAKAKDVGRDKAKVRPGEQGKPPDKINRIPLEKRSLTMPGGDRTGPMGAGPMTGRAAGYCAGNEGSGSANALGGRGFGGGRGCGGGGGRGRRARRNRFYATGLSGWQRAAAAPTEPAVAPAVSEEEGLSLLKRQADGLAGALDELKARIAELEAEPQEE